MLDSMEAAGIEPNATLHHFTHPQVRCSPFLVLSCVESVPTCTHTYFNTAQRIYAWSNLW
jgi:beta-glucosidase/6-phospho-beta-glucosidase/beta-galactosidase